jgi:hypothetical protein
MDRLTLRSKYTGCPYPLVVPNKLALQTLGALGVKT